MPLKWYSLHIETDVRKLLKLQAPDLSTPLTHKQTLLRKNFLNKKTSSNLLHHILSIYYPANCNNKKDYRSLSFTRHLRRFSRCAVDLYFFIKKLCLQNKF